MDRAVTQRVRDVMVPAGWTVTAACPLSEAARLMRSWDVKEVFVVDGTTLRGVLSDVDVVVLAIASGRSPAELVAGDCLTPDTVCLRSDEPVHNALAHLRHHGLRRAPVVDGDHFVGAVWLTDLEHACQREPADPGQHRSGHHREATPARGHRPRRDHGRPPRVAATADADPAADTVTRTGPVVLVSTPLLTVTVRIDGADSRVTVAGELDLSTTSLFAAALDEACERDVDLLTVDLEELTFADSSAIHALLRVRETARERGIRLRLTNVAGSLARTLAITGTHELFDIAHR